MTTSPLLTRAATAVAAAVSLAACGGTVDFSLAQDFDVDSRVPGVASATVDLAAEAGGAWKHRDKLDSVTITTAEATVVSVTLPAPPAAGTVSGQAWLLPDGASLPTDPGAVSLGTWTDEPVEVGNVIPLQLGPELDAFVRNAFNGSGRFSIYATATAPSGQVVACRLHAVLGGQLKWALF